VGCWGLGFWRRGVLIKCSLSGLVRSGLDGTRGCRMASNGQESGDGTLLIDTVLDACPGQSTHTGDNDHKALRDYALHLPKQ